MTKFKTEKIRSLLHLAFVRSHECLIHDGKGNRCNGTPVQAHHLTFLGGQGMRTKECDNKTVPLCFKHHRNLHDIGERKFWENWGIDAEQEARDLAAVSPDMVISKLYTIEE